MALRTRSTGARAAIAASRISQSERERLQRAVKDIESSIIGYKEKTSGIKHRLRNYGLLKKLGQGLTTLAQIGVTGPLSPVVGGVGLAVTGLGSYGEKRETKGFKKGAEGIDVSAADPLSDLLFVGREAKDVARGAKDIREEAILQGKLADQKANIQMALDIGKGIIGAGQAGTFDKFGDISGFLNKPLGGKYITDPGADASPLQKLTFQALQTKQPSVGSLLGGASPYEQDLGGQIYERGTRALNREYFRPWKKIDQGMDVGNYSDWVQNQWAVESAVAQSEDPVGRRSLRSYLPNFQLPNIQFDVDTEYNKRQMRELAGGPYDPFSMSDMDMSNIQFDVDTEYAKAQAQELAGGPYSPINWSDYATQSDYAQRVAESIPITKEIPKRTLPTISEWAKPYNIMGDRARELRKDKIIEAIRGDTGWNVTEPTFLDWLKYYRPSRPLKRARIPFRWFGNRSSPFR